MMSGQYHQLIQTLDALIENVNKLNTSKFLWNLGKNILGSDDVTAMRNLESLGGNIDLFADKKQVFTQWIVQSNVYITNSNFKKDSFLSEFTKQRNKVKREFDKNKVNAATLVTSMTELRTHLVALQQYGTVKSPKLLKEKQPKTKLPKEKNTIKIDKGNTVDILKQVTRVFDNSTKFLKVMDNWIGTRTLDYFATVPEIPVKILTSNIAKKDKISFEVMLRRINEERTKSIEVHLCKPGEFHDRYIINGKELWMIGSSLKDAGYTNWTTINPLNDQDLRKEINKIFDVLWKNSTSFCP